MARKRARSSRGLLAGAAAFAASPQGRKLIQQAREYAARPETKEKAQQIVAQLRARRAAARPGPPSPAAGDTPTYGTPPPR
jgi:hypothetical protein